MSRGIFGSRGFDAANECPKMRKELCEGRLVPVPHGDFGQELQADAELDDLNAEAARLAATIQKNFEGLGT